MNLLLLAADILLLMRFALIENNVRFVFAILDSSFLAEPITLEVTERPAAMFKAYLKDFGKHYEGEELVKRFEIFKDSLKEISRMNRESGATFGLTKFSDMATEEFIGSARSYNRTLGSRGQEPLGFGELDCGHGPFDSNIPYYYRDKNVSDRFDWRDVLGHRSYVGPVLDQKLCNGCWAFGIVGAMETQAAIIRGEYGPRLSIQELIDCSFMTHGCVSGNVFLALNWFCQNRWGVVTEEQYPLKLVTQQCEGNYAHQGLELAKFWTVNNINEADIPRLVNFHGPLIVVVNADPWRSYINGVIQGACVRKGNTFDHVVQIVGYDMSSDTDVPHYIVRNSWGEDFGEKGYVRLAMGGNVCGVADKVALVDVYA